MKIGKAVQLTVHPFPVIIPVKRDFLTGNTILSGIDTDAVMEEQRALRLTFSSLFIEDSRRMSAPNRDKGSY